MRDVYIIGAFSTAFGKKPETGFKALTREAYTGLLADAGLETGAEIETGWFSNCGMGSWGQRNIRGQVCFTPLVRDGLFPERVPMVNVEGGCASAMMALSGAFKDVASGEVELSMAMGVEKTFVPGDAERTKEIFEGGIDQMDPEEWRQYYAAAGETANKPFEYGPDRTVFMDTYAMQACYHMAKWGTTQHQIAIAASKNHWHGSLNPKAQYRFEVSPDEVLADRPVSFPLTRSMCAPIGDGAAGVLVCSKDYLDGQPAHVRDRAIRIAGLAMSGGKYRDLDEPGLSSVAAKKAYARAGLSPADIDLVELHDATSFCELYQLEMLGFCEPGTSGRFIEAGETRLGGRLPVNTSGGLVSKGHPVGATGLSMVSELATQLRHEAGDRQVADAKIALAENGGGVVGFDEAACAVAILARADA
ncbi:thiolase family protein [Tistrella mobilis]|uniref:thiolase family protein n=1 Tax=Tistrella mobilis TaxID=171437 RepID=UPI00355731CA